MNRTLVVLLLAACAAACAPALREPPPLSELVGGADAPETADVSGLLEEAEQLFARRELVPARSSAELFLRAASADETNERAWAGAVRTRVWLAGKEDRDEAREEAALSAVQTAQWCRRKLPDRPACTYWLAVALGVQARERRSTALDGIDTMVELLRQAAELEPGLDRAGPHRVLALVLLRAPGWPSGPGDPEEGLEQARHAAKLFPGYPPNLLCLAEALAENDEPEAAAEAYRQAAALARGSLAEGHPDARGWLTQAEAALPDAAHR